MRISRLQFLIIGTITLALLAIFFFIELNRTMKISIRPSARPLLSDATGLAMAGSEPIYGNPGAPITIVMFGDVTCPSCRRGLFTITKLIDTYPTRARFIWKDAPRGNFFTKADTLPFQAAYCASKQKKYWDYLRLLTQYQNDFSAAALENLAQSLNINTVVWKECLFSEEAKNKVSESSALAQDMGIQNLPAIFVNNQSLNLEKESDLEKALEILIQPPIQ